jgi:DNA-binding MarR family transcriptional regulator
MGVPAELLAERYVGCLHRMRRLLDDAMCATGLSMARAKVLGLLAQEGPTRQSGLASRLGFAPRSITDAVDALERSGFAERRDDPTDRRARLVAITPTGQAALTAAMETKLQLLHEIFGGLDDESRETFMALLNRIDAAVTDAGASRGEPRC